MILRRVKPDLKWKLIRSALGLPAAVGILTIIATDSVPELACDGFHKAQRQQTVTDVGVRLAIG